MTAIVERKMEICSKCEHYPECYTLYNESACTKLKDELERSGNDVTWDNKI